MIIINASAVGKKYRYDIILDNGEKGSFISSVKWNYAQVVLDTFDKVNCIMSYHKVKPIPYVQHKTITPSSIRFIYQYTIEIKHL